MDILWLIIPALLVYVGYIYFYRDIIRSPGKIDKEKSIRNGDHFPK